jgi:aldehyde:ferredoxin oxidoreductase
VDQFDWATGLTTADDRLPELIKYEKLPSHDVVWDVPDEIVDAMFAD